MAGSAAAISNNNLGVAGSCQQCQLMLIRNGNTTFTRSQAFGYAQAMGAAVITNSWGFAIGTAIPLALQNAINAAATNGRGGLGAVIFWAMNNPSNNDCIGATPDLSSLANVIAVSRVTNQDQFNSGGFGKLCRHRAAGASERLLDRVSCGLDRHEQVETHWRSDNQQPR